MVNPTPDLQAILASLANYAPPPPVPPFGGAFQTTTRSDHLDADASTLSIQDQNLRTEDPRPRPQSRNSATASPKPIDPATITTWQDGLRCVTKIAAQNAQFSAMIRKMITDQKNNELRWYSERQALKQTQANRAGSAAQAQSILQSLGGSMKADLDDPEEGSTSKEAELTAFDRKIYTAQLEMEGAMIAQLKSLGVPFFGTDQSLITSDDEASSLKLVPESQPRWSPVVTETQLMELRRRIVGHLEDLYRE